MGKWTEAAAKRARAQCSTGNADLDKAIAFYIQVGFEDGAEHAETTERTLLTKAHEALTLLITNTRLAMVPDPQASANITKAQDILEELDAHGRT